MKKKSMIRGEDCKPLSNIFSGEFFKFPTIYSKNFLGKKRYFVIAPNETDHDIVKKNDLKNLEIVIRKNYSTYKKFIHLNLRMNDYNIFHNHHYHIPYHHNKKDTIYFLMISYVLFFENHDNIHHK